MRSTAHTTKLTRALAGVLVAAAVAAPAAGARPIDSVRPADVPPPPSSIAAGAGIEYGDLRAHDATAASPPVVAEPSAPAGFDWTSAAIGAAAAAAASLVSLTALGFRRRPGGVRAE
jgi:hypothetical protein